MSKDLDEALVRKLAGLLEETGLGEIEYATGDLRIRIAKPTINATYAAPAPAAAPAAVAAAAPAAAVEESGEVVPSPMVGTAYVAPEPGAAAFAPVGSNVRKGQTIMIVEAMKTMNPIPAPRDGKIKAVHVENGQPVEFGQPLLVLE
ncbi:acetyl-CoA carboxylase biotin carboxyl carrier protein [Thalassobaculum sp. OXR-137]|uniref:acetyl-CoA carboxylase biotin carboxyl carrier protein n=1 Tax=Thalassobaculum sp. OXR-137 TaxID=3100173 RepID=UPI002AC9390A|nr:acetyl-CoA carboxylase biotin carboxyl carrier protein [Thalassobaculum sp. OXR-137]WPZ34251.1 acetyl-CoA carboxylase biotin carboxyl carrier protein [Thalassobaculum sp. OXR-137]